MKAAIWTAYGPPDVLQIRDVPQPIPGPNELLIRIHATTVTMGDCELRRFRPFSVFLIPMRLRAGLLKPTRMPILGQELSGVVAALGRDVTRLENGDRFQEGDAVFAATGFQLGAYAQYTCLPQDGMVALKPPNLSHEEAAAVPLGGLEAYHYLSQANIHPGQTVLINGAGGSIGTIAVQLARHFGAEVTAVDSADKLDMLRAIGAAYVVDYTQQDFTQTGRTYDLIFDVIGTHSAARCAPSLKPGGRYLSANPGARQQLRALWSLLTRGRQVVAEYTRIRRQGLHALRDLLQAETIRPVVDRRYPLQDIAEAHRYVETGRKKGSVVITLP